jgi:hypothetical protein
MWLYSRLPLAREAPGRETRSEPGEPSAVQILTMVDSDSQDLRDGAPEPADAEPEPNVDAPEHLMPTKGGAFAEDPEGTTDAENMRIRNPRERPNSSSAPE